jgi:DNA-binding CsgD family transcriptional regulator
MGCVVAVSSGDAVFSTRADSRIAAWNEECERLTGVGANEAEGRYCWEVIAGRDARGGIVCHPGCSVARLAREGWPVRCADLRMRTASGERQLTISTIVLQSDGETTVLHPLRVAAPIQPPPAAPSGLPEPSLTPRQREILLLLMDGLVVKQIAVRLTLCETTVRNHIRGILRELGAHSQLEAVARARTLSLVREVAAA